MEHTIAGTVLAAGFFSTVGAVGLPLMTFIGALGLALGIAVAYRKQGTVTTALQTVEFLRTQVDGLRQENASLKGQVSEMRVNIKFLTEQITQAAKVDALAEWGREQAQAGLALRERDHNENMLILSRIEGSVSRIERATLREPRGERREGN